MDSSPAAASSSSPFLTLPVTLQLDIVKLVGRDRWYAGWRNELKLRLVCKHTAALVNYLGLSMILFATPSSFKRLTTCPFSCIDYISLAALTQPLPINSSTRLQLPKAVTLELGSQISLDNLKKLIRYYVKWCSTLVLSCAEFPITMKSMQDFGCSRKCLANIKCLCIKYSVDDAAQMGCLNKCGQFLDWASMPDLRELYVNIYSDVNSPPIPADYKFCEHLSKFLIKHGPQLQYLNLLLPTRIWEHILVEDALECMYNVEALDLLNMSLYLHYEPNINTFGSIDQSLVLKGFSHFTQLTSLFLSFETQIELIHLLLANNAATLKVLEFHQNIFSSLSWFYQIQHRQNQNTHGQNLSFHHLTYLYIKIEYDPKSSLFAQTPPHFNLPALSGLGICIDCKNMARYDDFSSFTSVEDRQNFLVSLDWREPFCHWLIQISPKLTYLSFFYYPNDLQLRMSDITLMTLNLRRLETIRLKEDFFWMCNDQAMSYDLIVGLQSIEPKDSIMTPELKNWLKENPQNRIKLKIYRKSETLITISRPYPYFIVQPLEVEEEETEIET